MSPYLGEKVDVAERAADYERLLGRVIDRSVVVQPQTELFVVRHLMFYEMGQRRFTDAQTLIDACEQRLAPLIKTDLDIHASLLEKRGFLLTDWCEYAEEQGYPQQASTLREQAIAVYQQSNALLTDTETQAQPLKRSMLKKRLARSLTNLGFHLSRLGQFEELFRYCGKVLSSKKKGMLSQDRLQLPTETFHRLCSVQASLLKHSAMMNLRGTKFIGLRMPEIRSRKRRHGSTT